MTSNLPEITLKQGREKSLRRLHPWIFSGAIGRVEGQPEPGSTVRVSTSSGEFLAYAAYSPASQIRARVWTFDPDVKVDEALIRQRISVAVDMRRRLGLLDERNACRLVFSESDGLPGLIVDRYASHLVCQFLSAGAELWRDEIVRSLEEGLSPGSIHERSEANVRRKEGLSARRGLLRGEAPAGPIEFLASGIRQLVDLEQGQKTGSYLDQQWNHLRVASYAKDRKVLDAYSYAGGFAIAALNHGARDATLIDSSADALKLAERQAGLNEVAGDCRYINGSVPEELRKMRESGERFDLVVLDPPKFVSAVQQLKSGCRGYKDINMLGMQLLNPGGILATFSCSGHVSADLFQKIVAGAAVDVKSDVQILERLAQSPDHPVALPFPEADYLTGLILRVSNHGH